jgi:hypothetical protein
MALEFGTRGIDISSNMILNGVDYLVTDVAVVAAQPNQRRVTTYPAPPSITTGAQIKFHQLSNISTGGLVMEYGGSGVTYNALPKYGGVPIRTREINEVAPGKVFYSTVDNIGNLKIGDFFTVNQLTGEVTIDANSFNLSGLNAIGPFKRNGVAVGVVLQEISNNTTLLNSQGLFGEDTVPTQYAVKEYVQEINTSLDGRLDKLEQTSGSLNTFSSSALIRLSNLESTSASHNGRLNNLETKSASVDISLVELNSYTASLKQAITASGTNVTINGNLTVKGTTTQIDSTTLNIGDNIIELNYGGSQTISGIYTKDATGTFTSGSLLWNSTTDRWIAGASGSESTILLAGGDSVISSSGQLGDLNTFTASVTSSLVSIYQTTASLNLFSASVTSSLVSIYQTTASLNTATASLYTSASLMTASITSLTASVVALQQFSGNVNLRFDNLQTYTTSVDSKFTTLGNCTASLNQTTASLNQFSASVTSSLVSIYQTTSSLNQFSASVTSSLVSIYQTTASLNSFSESVINSLVSIYQTTASLNLFTASAYVSFSLMTASIDDHEDRIQYVEQLNGYNGGNPLTPLNVWSASINTFTSSTNSRLNNIELATSSYETVGRGIVSGSSQVTPLLPTGVISGSIQILGGSGVWSSSLQMPAGVVSGAAQILITELDGYADYNDAIMGDINGKEEVASATHTLISGSSQVTLLLPSGVISGSSQLPSGIVSGSSQIVPLLPTGVISGSSQILGGTDIHSGSAGNYQFNSIGVGTAGSTVAGEIRAIADITAYYSSDERLKENIKPIQNALSKVESISGNTYDWKDGFETIHSHKGKDIGVIAQEIEKVLPELVTNRETGYKAVQYEKLTALLIEAIKELSAKVKELENK